VRTRTLLLLATLCGLAILVAGVFLLLKLSNQSQQASEDIGRVVRVGDMAVTVEHVSEREGSLLVDIEIGGVDDAEGANAFRLVVPGKALVADPTAGNHCGATTVPVQPCTLAFRLPADVGSSRVLLYQRGDERVRWDLGDAGT
jgi:NADPH:quinone reductase-like Zn-dependent oxidoreductase